MTNFKETSILKPQNNIKLGHKVANVALTNGTLGKINLYDIPGDWKIISTFPSIDTSVCDIQTKKIYEIAKAKNITLINVSTDLPFALNKWCMLNNISDINILSDYNGINLGKELGIVIDGFNLLYRTIFILNKENELVYYQFVQKVTDQIDFDNLSEFISIKII
ncbi:MAG: redoxin domain-containing protein [Malacoplasma sp.]